MISISKNVFTDKLVDIINECNNTYHSIIKMKPVDVKLSKYIDLGVKDDDKDPKFEFGDHVRISKCKKNLSVSASL